MPENLVVTLISSDTSEVRVPATVTIPAGLTWVEFDIDTVDELAVDGARTVTITALADRFTSGSDTLMVEPVDNAEGYDRSGDQNRHRDQGQIVIDSNIITNSSEAGIRVEAGDRTVQFNGVTTSDMPHPGTVINFANRNTQNLAPGVVIQNNVIAYSGHRRDQLPRRRGRQSAGAGARMAGSSITRSSATRRPREPELWWRAMPVRRS